MPIEREIDVSERPEVPLLSVVLGYGPMLPITAAAAASWVLSGDFRNGVIQTGAIYAASILAFLGGVRRGVSFRTEGGPQVAQILTMAGLWLVAFLALLCININMLEVAFGLLLLGYLTIMILDPIAARAGEAPLFFARLRRPQMVIAITSLIALVVSSARNL